MDINQELERLHKAFQINQEFNAGDKSTDIIHLIARIHNSALGLFNSPIMDMSLKDEMTRAKTDKSLEGESFGPDTSDDHGFIISDEIRPKFDLFKRFLADNEALNYWVYNNKLPDFFQKRNFYTWLCEAFTWGDCSKGVLFWSELNSAWKETLVQIDAIVNQEISKEEPWDRFVIPEEKKEAFEKFKLFLLEEGCSDEFWENAKEKGTDFFESCSPYRWVYNHIQWMTTKQGHGFWSEVDDKWLSLCK
jgi:hypothetical protein